MGSIQHDLYNVISNMDDINEELLLIRLYDEYNKYNKLNLSRTDKVTLLKVRSSYNNILKSITNNIELLADEEKNKFVQNKINILEFNITNLDIKDNKKIYNCIDIITKLECFFRLPVTFPNNLERCIKQEIENNEKVKKRVR